MRYIVHLSNPAGDLGPSCSLSQSIQEVDPTLEKGIQAKMVAGTVVVQGNRPIVTDKTGCLYMVLLT